MKIYQGLRLLAFFLLCTASMELKANVVFGSRDSAFKIASGARFNISSSNLSIDGTLQAENGADLSGNPIAFENGVLYSNGLEALLLGTYDPAAGDSVELNGNGRLRAEPGTLLQALTVQGINNRIEGQPLFSEPIVLKDANTALTLAMQDRLNQHLVLNGGTIRLDDDLGLADGVRLNGTGRVELNNRELRLPSINQPWTNSLYFNNAADVVLTGTLELTGTWTFGGVSFLNGNGSLLDISKGGQVIVDNNSTLYVDDLNITGIGDTAGKLILRNGASVLKASSSTFKLNDHHTNNQGVFYVQGGPSTFLLGQKNWNFNANGNLTVDGTSLWLDYLDSPCDFGNVNAPLPLFDGMAWNGPNLVTDLASGNLSLIRRGTIKQSVDRSIAGISPSECTLLDGCFTGTLALDGCICVMPSKGICVNGGFACINGQGSVVDFTNPDHAQLTVAANTILMLSNITLRNITQNTIDMREGARIWIGENVIWELDENITFSHGNIVVLNGSDGCAPLGADSANVFKIRGETCRRNFAISPLIPSINGVPVLSFDLGHNTIQLENVQLSGFSHISFFNDVNFAAAVALSCNASADIDVDTAMNFFVEGINNDITLRNDGLNLSGNITFGDEADNNLRIIFALSAPLAVGRVVGADAVLEHYPYVTISGDPGIFLFSDLGIAHIDFDNLFAGIDCQNANAFVIDDHSFLTFKNLQVLENPLKQQSTLFGYEGLNLFGRNIDPSFLRSPLRDRSKHIKMNALIKLRQDAKEKFAQAQNAAAKPNPAKPAATKPSKPKNTKPAAKARDGEIVFDENFEEFNGDADYMTRALQLPPLPFDSTASNVVTILTLPETGNKEYQGGKITNFTVDGATPFNIVLTGLLYGGVEVTQGDQKHSVLRTGIHSINIIGPGNVINVTGKMTINPDTLFFDKDAELTFNFVDDGSGKQSEVHFTSGTVIDLERKDILRFTGNGIVTWANNTELHFKGHKKIDLLTGAEHVNSRPQLIITEQAKMSLDAGAQMRMTGIGEVEVSNGGQLVLDVPSTLIFGLDTEKLPGNKDCRTPSDRAHDFLLDVIDDGIVQLGHSAANGQARISFRYVSSVIQFSQGGTLYIGTGGRFEINANHKTANPGHLKELSFSPQGSLLLAGNGRFAMGSNRKATLPATGQPFPFIYKGLFANFPLASDPGSVEFVADPLNEVALGFFGPFNPSAPAFNNYTSMTALQLITLYRGV